MASPPIVLLALAAGPFAGVAASPLCFAQHCASELGKCLLDKACRANFGCTASCITMGSRFGGCVEACHMDNPSELSDLFTACLFSNHCVDIPFPMEGNCKVPKQTKPIGLKMLEGLWWVVHGFDETVDCEPCNFREWHPKPNSGNWSYGDNTGVVDRKGQYRNFTYFIEVSAAEVGPKDSLIFFWGSDSGMSFKEEWWLLDDTPDYKQIYYCTTDLKIHPGKQLEGAVILSKAKQIPESASARIAEIYMSAVGLDYDAFCTNDNTCPTGPAASAQALEVVV